MVSCRKIAQKLLVTVLCGMVALPILAGNTVYAENATATIPSKEKDNSYYNYYCEIAELPTASDNIVLKPFSKLKLTDGKKAVNFGAAHSSETYEFTVKSSGVYCLAIDYHTFDTDSTTIMLDITIDGKYYFEELGKLELPRYYKDELADGKFAIDKDGDEVRPSQNEIYTWNELYLADSTGLYSEPYLIYLTEGNHSLVLSTENDLAVSKLCFSGYEAGISYDQYKAQISDKNRDVKAYRQEAEYAEVKNASSLYPIYDNTNASMVPQSYKAILLNSIGGSNWSNTGDKISWKAEIKTAGLYTVSLRVNQSYNESGNSYRKFTINGVCPFREAATIAFEYSTDWYIKTLGGDNPYIFYLEPGDELALEVVVDEASAKMARDINNVMLQMNSLYRKMLVITGPDVDIYRDYALDTQIPELLDSLNNAKKQLDNIVLLMEKRKGSGSTLSTVKQVRSVIHTMIEESYVLHEHVRNFADAITNLGSVVNTIGLQGLAIDSFFFQPVDKELEDTEVSFFKKIIYEVNRFLYSFVKEYDLKNTSDESLLVWVSTGRDQLQLLTRMIEGYFVPEHNVNIELNLVDTGATLIQATLAGKGPDVALMIPEETPINLAMRGGLVDLKQYDLSDISKEFYDSAWTPYYYNGGLYAIPETQNFDVIFYRTDIFEELGITPPQTWEDFYQILEILQRNNLQVGVPEINPANAGVSSGIATFQKFLLQNGGSYYSEDLSRTAFDSNIAKDAFYNWVQLYKKYGLDREYDFYNRFRSGEMPMAIQNLNYYNQIYTAAPEIRGLWSIATIPGTKAADGTINKTETATGTACIMLNSAVEKGLGEQAFDFMKWWTCSSSQAMYAKELESTMGVAARYYPANKVAFDSIAWTKKEAEIILDQWSCVENIPQVPGNYVLQRDLTSAFRKALNDIELPERQLEIYNQSINEEISRKRKEFSLE